MAEPGLVSLTVVEDLDELEQVGARCGPGGEHPVGILCNHSEFQRAPLAKREPVPPPSHHPCVSPAWLIVVNHPLPPDVQTYLDGIAAEHRPMWHRVEGLVRVLHPGAELRITYGMPTFVVGEHRLPVGVWKHGLSLYGLDESDDAGFIARHPELSTGRGTVKLPTKRADDFSDEELTATLKAVLDA